ncbi:regulator of protease activity HflC (stomatin/prohibitin superfamily) [Nonlabens dokdonensis]|jgi:regulator of protease activity HflC (stomatin/prohibitin superfamily)|uniref:Regulator of protease activity HflC (Stomatin/prohibitin superfamily) n=2 Tax=Nonlabens dokdonensis TaxID=328515 RepID=A0ABX5Q1Y5_9FLAO|nr:prohibitin family protein [Nonlabens dokdonensis]AGC76257.1 putative Spfh domain / band 7 family [Nonlabens dokdonensis DSW-6]PZX43919.1 regulator of protease activity HflC (stomatin/prohibitin superfamily) [Nonlabens dokdonensis]
MRNLLMIFVASLFITSCAVIRPGEAGVKQRLGKLDNEVVTQGTIVFNPFTTKVIKESIQTNNLKLALRIPSKEGLSVDSEISILYRLEVEKLPTVLENIGPNYKDVMAAVFRSASSDVCAQFYAKDMHSGKRADIEKAIKEKMETTLTPQGIIIEAVLMKSIQLPPGLSLSIEQKLQAEQDAMRMEFILQSERLEADRKIIEATGSRDAQKILAQGLTPEILKLRSIEAFIQLSKSANSKVIITDGKTPFLINGEKN